MSVVVAPARTPDGRWIQLVFSPGSSSGEAITLQPGVRFAPLDAKEGAEETRTRSALQLRSLKSRLCTYLERQLPRAAIERIRRGCPSVAGFDPDSMGPVDVLLSCREERSWELAYLLACLVSAEVGRWPGNRIYFATGALEDDATLTAHQDVLEEKCAFVFGQPGNVVLLAPAVNPIPGLPPGKELIAVRDVLDLFRVPASPLHDITFDDEWTSGRGAPACFSMVLEPATFQTRSPVKDALLEVLRDDHIRLVVLASSLGWGKTTLIAKACHDAALPVRVVDLSGVENRLRIIEQLLRGVLLSSREALDVDDPALARGMLKSFIDPGTLLVFINASVNAAQTMSREVQSVIAELVTIGFRCVVETWDTVGFDASRLPSRAVAHIPQLRLPPLSDGEVAAWLAAENVPSELTPAFSHLDGHPYGVAVTLQKIRFALGDGIPVTVDDVLDFAVDWAEVEDIRSYILRVERLIGAKLPMPIIQWFALFWPHPLHGSLVQDPVVDNQLRLAVRLGLARYDGQRYAARGWMHLYCVGELRRLLVISEGIELDWDQLGSVEPVEAHRIERQLRTVARSCPAIRQAIHDLLARRPEPQVGASRMTIPEEYVAPADRDVALETATGRSTTTELLWALEQMLRNRMQVEAAQLWSQLLDPIRTPELLDLLGRSTAALGALSRSHWVASFSQEGASSVTPILADLLHKLEAGEAEHALGLALFLSDIGQRLIESGDRGRAEQVVERVTEILSRCKRSDQTDGEVSDSHLWELVYRTSKSRYALASTVKEALIELENMLSVASRAIRAIPRSLRWQRRFLWAIQERLSSTPVEPELEREFARQILSLHPTDAVADFIQEAVGVARAGDVHNAMKQIAKSYCHQVLASRVDGQRDRPPASLYMLCGVVMQDGAAVQAAATELLSFWTGDCADEAREDQVRLMLTVMRHNVTDRSKLIQRMKKAFHEQTPEGLQARLRGVKQSLAGRIWSSYLHGYEAEVREAYRERERIAVRSEAKLDVVLRKALVLAPDCTTQIMIIRCRTEKIRWQRELFGHRAKSKERIRRIEVARTIPFPKKQQVLLEEFLRRCPVEHVAWNLWARFQQYVWNAGGAIEAGDRSLTLAKSITQRRHALVSLFELLSTILYTPDVLRSSQRLPDEAAARQRLYRVMDELLVLWPQHPELAAVRDGLEGDEAFWRGKVKHIHDRLGPPEAYWDAASQKAVLSDETSDEMEWSIRDITDSILLVRLAMITRWACWKPDLDLPLRLELAQASLSCMLASRSWARGTTGRGNVTWNYSTGCSIALALLLSDGRRIFGREDSPLPGPGGRTLTWREAMEHEWAQVRAKAIGHFAAHADVVIERLTGLLDSNPQPLRA